MECYGSHAYASGNGEAPSGSSGKAAWADSELDQVDEIYWNVQMSAGFDAVYL